MELSNLNFNERVYPKLEPIAEEKDNTVLRCALVAIPFLSISLQEFL